MQPKLIIHGGAGSALDNGGSREAVAALLAEVVAQVYADLAAGGSAAAAVIKGCELLEDEPLFNAGTGAVLQEDGQIRLSAGFMDGQRQAFSGVINASRVQHPIQMAAYLQTHLDRIVASEGAVELAREMNLTPYNPLTPKRLEEWLRLQSLSAHERFATSVVADSPTPLRTGTIGVVALDATGTVVAGTSTGGRGFERIGRVSDSATPAGNYANAAAGVSCTGVGEDILDEGLATRVVVRVTDGMSLQAALDKSFAEARDRDREFGAIALSSQGDVGWAHTTAVLLAAYHDGVQIGLTF